jgi:hypothetical protein
MLDQKKTVNTSNFAKDYKTFKIERLARRGIYQVTDNAGNLIIILPLLSQAKKFIDNRIAKAGN